MEPMKPLEPMEPMEAEPAWWPGDLGRPDAAGGQGGMRYAYFATARRLAVRHRDEPVVVYDTADHRISGVAQRQHPGAAGGGSATFTSQHGDVVVGDLRVVR